MRKPHSPPTASLRLAGRRPLVAGAVAAAVAVALYGSATTFSANAQQLQTQVIAPAVAADALPGSFATLVKAVRPAVVHVDTTATRRNTGANALPPGVEIPEPFRRFFQQRPFGQNPGQPVRGVGSGFVIDSTGYIVTNNHVIDGAQEIAVTLHDGTRLDAALVGTDPKTDLALLRVTPDAPLTAVRMADSDSAEVGDWVVAVGSPYGLGGTVTAGIISARGRDINSGPYDDYLQIDAPINRGNSGGPLFNRHGEVVGINTAIFSPSGGNVGIGFAIPANQADPIISDLRADGRVQRGWLGVSIQGMDDDLAASMGLADSDGALVANVSDDSPAKRDGLRVGDIVLDLDGEPVTSPKDLSRLVAARDDGEKVTLRIWRDGKARNVDVTLGALAEQVAAATPTPATPAEGPRIGLSLAPLTDAQRERYGLAEGEQGVLVAGVDPNGPAAEEGIRAGDVIVKVGPNAVDAPQDVVAAIRESKSKRVLLLVNRDGNQRFVTVPVMRDNG